MRKHIGIILTGVLAVTGIVVDNGLRWRSEMGYRDFDRQTRLLENIMSVSAFEERRALINFYLSLEAFSSPIKERMTLYVQQPAPTTPRINLNRIPSFPLPSVKTPRIDAMIQQDSPFNDGDLSSGLRALRENTQ